MRVLRAAISRATLFAKVSGLFCRAESIQDLWKLLGAIVVLSVKFLGPVVQSIVSVTSPLVTNSLTVVAKVFSNALILFFFLLKKFEHIFSAKYINVFAIFQDRNFDVILTNNLVKFWTTRPWWFSLSLNVFMKHTWAMTWEKWASGQRLTTKAQITWAALPHHLLQSLFPAYALISNWIKLQMRGGIR